MDPSDSFSVGPPRPPSPPELPGPLYRGVRVQEDPELYVIHMLTFDGYKLLPFAPASRETIARAFMDMHSLDGTCAPPIVYDE